MTEPAAGPPRRPSRGVEIGVGAIAATIGVGLTALALLGVYRALTEPSPAGVGTWAFVSILLLVGGFLLVKGTSFIRGAKATTEEPLLEGQVRRRPLVAGLLSLLVMGAGQLYNGQWGKAAAFYLGACSIAGLWLFGLTGRVFWGLVVTVLGVLALKIASIVDAALVARRSRVMPRQWFASWWLLAPAVVASTILPTAFTSLQVVKSYYLPSGSMEPTLAVGDRVIADLDYFDDRPLEVGAVVILRSPEDPSTEVAKRVVALGGDRVEMRNKELHVNGVRVQEPWVVHRDPLVGGNNPRRAQRDNFAPLVLPKHTFFALGDNRDESYDSRFFGPVPIDNLRGKLLFIYWSADRSRIGRAL